MWVQYIKDYPEKYLFTENILWTDDVESAQEDIAAGYAVEVADCEGTPLDSE